jgi:hypothetical protein
MGVVNWTPLDYTSGVVFAASLTSEPVTAADATIVTNAPFWFRVSPAARRRTRSAGRIPYPDS